MTIVWIGIEIAFPFLILTYSLLIAVFGGSFLFALVGAYRNQIVRRIANHGFVVTFWAQRVFRWIPLLGASTVLIGVLSLRGIIPDYSPALSIIFVGLYFFLVAPRLLIFPQMMLESREARLCLLQFLLNWNTGKPVHNTGHNWLRRGLRGIEQRLKAFGLPVPSRELFFGSSYALFKGHASNTTFEELAQWLLELSNYSEVNWTIPFLMSEAKKAEEDGFERPGRSFDSFRNLKFMTLERLASITIILGAIYGLLTYFGILK